MISEMAAYYKTLGMTLYDALEHLYEKYGYYMEDLVSFTCKGLDGLEKIERIMSGLRSNGLVYIGDYSIKIASDYLSGETADLFHGYESKTNLPSSNVLRYTLEDGSWFAVRPSGTEPKLKIYFSAIGANKDDCEQKLAELKAEVLDLLNIIGE
jgi:phosphoglucomutase